MTTATRCLITLALCLSACQKKNAEPRFKNEPAQPAAAAAAPAVATPAPSAPVPTTPAEPTPPSAPAAEAPHAEVEAPKALVRNPTSADPLGGKFTLAQATAGLPKKGAIEATIETGLGALECKLYDDKAPNTVANFVGLARGLRPFWDARAVAWVKRPLFDGTTFHRTIPDFMIQGGDYLGDGSGEIGYVIPDEVKTGLSHDRAGLLCMANRGPNTNGGQFFITDAATPHLTQMGTYTIFGECKPVDLVARIARGPSRGEHPEQPVVIKHVQIARK